MVVGKNSKENRTMRKRKSKGIAFSDFTSLIQGMQEVLKEENKVRVEMSEDDNWDLVKEIIHYLENQEDMDDSWLDNMGNV